MAVDNNTIIGDFLLRNTNDAQQLGLNSTLSGLSQGMMQIFEPYNGDIYNHFLDWMIKVPAFEYTRNVSFENRLRPFIKRVTYGGSVIENQVGWIQEHSLDVQDSKLLKTYFPNGAQAYHTQNRQGVFPITVNRDDLRTAFSDEYGLNAFAAEVMQAPINSDELQTYQYMKQLFAEYDAEHPMYTVTYEKEPETVDTARLLLADMVAWAEQITFPSVRWNATGDLGKPIATFDRPENMVLMVTPRLYGFYKVLGFGMLFHRDEAEAPYRVVVMDEFPMPDVFAVLCSESWFQTYDTEYGNYSFFDPDTLNTQYRLHHWQILHASPFAPIVAFGTRANPKDTATVTLTTTGLTLTPATADVPLGGTLQLVPKLTGSVSPATKGVGARPDAVTYEVSAHTDDAVDPKSVPLNSRTRVDSDDVLHVQASGLAVGTKIDVKATSAYTNPSGAATEYTATMEVTVTAPQ